MHKLDTILFDLDGTLLPMEQKAFIDTYFGLLAKRLSAMGREPAPILDALWRGTGAMMQNDGGLSNRDLFWQDFARRLGPDALALETEMSDFYATDFNDARSILGHREDIRPLFTRLRAKGYGLSLATNPLFPMVAVQSRLAWIGLKEGDFDYITTYENSRYCKPHLGYFRDILAALGKEPGQCMMIGNNPVDDMAPAALGFSVFLLTDNLEKADSVAPGAYPQGSFTELAALLSALPPVS